MTPVAVGWSAIPFMNRLLKNALALVVLGGGLSQARAADDATSSGKVFGQTSEGKTVQIYTLRNDQGYEARITNYGGIVVSLKVPDKAGHFDDIVMGFDKLDDYLAPGYIESCPYFGALIGRYANRIAKGKFTLQGKEYQLPLNNKVNSLHGGPQGFDKRVWQAHEHGGPTPSLELTYDSADGEEGYSGKVSVKAVYTLLPASLQIVFTATTDKTTVINLTSHSYFNLKGAGNGDILDHEMQIEADAFTPINATSIPLPGGPMNVAGTPFDFTRPTRIGARIEADDQQLKNAKGYDHNFVLRDYTPGGKPRRIATVTEATTGRKLSVWSDQPGVQFYTGNFLDGTLIGKGGKVYPKRGAFCLEPQHYPDSPNRPDFPSVVLRPGETYHHTIVYEFGVAE